MWRSSVAVLSSIASAWTAVQAIATTQNGDLGFQINSSFTYGIIAIVGVATTVVATMSWVDKRISKAIVDHERYERKSFEDRFDAHDKWSEQSKKDLEKEIKYLRSRLNALYGALATKGISQLPSSTMEDE